MDAKERNAALEECALVADQVASENSGPTMGLDSYPATRDAAKSVALKIARKIRAKKKTPEQIHAEATAE